jgi:hypothetical protein
MTTQERQEALSILVEMTARGELLSDERREQWMQIFELVIHDIMRECEIDLDDANAFETLATQWQEIIFKNARIRREYLEQQAA